MNKLFEFLRNKNINSMPAPRPRAEEQGENLPESNEISMKSRPVIETQTEMDYEFYKSNYPDLSEEGYVDHVIEDLKGGNLKPIKIEEANHWVQFATGCKVWHKNPKYALRRSFALAISEIGGNLNLSMSEGAKMFDGFRTYREKKRMQTEQKQQSKLVPDFRKKEEEW